MNKFSYIDNANPAYIDDLYKQYLQDPSSLENGWAKFFEGYSFADQNGVTGVSSQSLKEIAVTKLINAYRARGHLIAQSKPISPRRRHKADLELDFFGLSDDDLNLEFDAGREIGLGRAKLSEILDHLKKTYCESIGVEFMYCRNERLRTWLFNTMEPVCNRPNFHLEEKRHILRKIQQAVTFESFLQTKYVGKKRFSLEGLESLIPALDAVIRQAALLGAKEFILGMAHRGRLNVLVNIFGKKYEDVFSEFEGASLPNTIKGDGDVKYHLGRSASVETEGGYQVHLSLLPNPSHLEAVNPVLEGKVYAKIRETYEGDESKIIPILIHGDAAFSGQGVNYEVVNISKLNGYRTGGTVHIVLNNQVGFTTSNREGRSSVYCTDLAKVTESPVFHVNGDDPEAVVHAVQMAVRIRQEFHIDVYVDIVGYRRYGHNEGDEPRFTQPVMYSLIDKHESILQVFLKQLIKNGDISQEDADRMQQELKDTLQKKLEYVKTEQHAPDIDFLKGPWTGFRQATEKDFDKSVETGASPANLEKAAKALVTVPDDIQLFAKMKKILEGRQTDFFEKSVADWAMAELLAYGTLLLEGYNVRLSGQDSQRGTFSHRHAVVKDIETEKAYIPLNHIADKQASFEVYNSLLSEYCIMGFEYGYSVTRPKTLVLWEAQFGDFSNGAQIIIDQFLASAESKWQRLSGLTLLLPHGYEGQGPEHSSARPERFLQLCAEENMYVVNPTTPANFFHLLRRQMKNEFRIPLVVMTPKSLLRHPLVISKVKELEKGRFQEVIDDVSATPDKIRRVVLCSGKVYYDLLQEKTESGDKSVALVRLEQLYPLPVKQLAALKKRYAQAKDWIWLQEEPENMGGWAHILRHLVYNGDFNLRLISRKPSASPATANEKEHAKVQKHIVKQAFAR